jgi:sec-independent protein translocase protein TatA
MNLGWMELTLVFVIVLLLFGTKKLPELGKGLGSGIRNFKSALHDSERGEIPEERAEPAREISDRSTSAR